MGFDNCAYVSMHSDVHINVVKGCVSAVLVNATFDHVCLDISVQLRNREGSVAASADFFYIFRASADGNPISRCCSREMGLPSAATLEM